MKIAMAEKKEMLFLAMGDKKPFKGMRRKFEECKDEMIDAVISRYLRFCRDQHGL